VSRVEFVVDGAVRATVTAAPYAWDWDTAAESPGAHTLTVRAVGADGTVAEQSLSVTVQGPTAP
jgi:leucyl aminopeptidase